ncbi:hypothetical protein AVEN_218147-1 [Araneus ventricosus]|uniref:Uncharacterized protein n=1 Tax=Araneus ventricosus TaxID=182803 RepID=A0A4Y2SE77_ARAVE|nr:hypothetical protein AVEN_218147-1 [Araneus ventricosus]
MGIVSFFPIPAKLLGIQIFDERGILFPSVKEKTQTFLRRCEFTFKSVLTLLLSLLILHLSTTWEESVSIIPTSRRTLDAMTAVARSETPNRSLFRAVALS